MDLSWEFSGKAKHEFVCFFWVIIAKTIKYFNFSFKIVSHLPVIVHSSRPIIDNLQVGRDPACSILLERDARLNPDLVPEGETVARPPGRLPREQDGWTEDWGWMHIRMTTQWIPEET